jgi:hypothetical protein
MNDELQRAWNGVVVTKWRYHPGIYHEELNKIRETSDNATKSKYIART